MPAPLRSPDCRPGEWLALTDTTFATLLEGPDDRNPEVAGRPGNAPISCGWVTSAVSKTTWRTT
jgi:hypothetical protein